MYGMLMPQLPSLIEPSQRCCTSTQTGILRCVPALSYLFTLYLSCLPAVLPCLSELRATSLKLCLPTGGLLFVLSPRCCPPTCVDSAVVQKDGGQLVLYNAAYSRMDAGKIEPGSPGTQESAQGYLAGEPALLVAPLAGRLLVFNSRLEHEVLPAYKHRYSISAFFYKGNPSAEIAATAPPEDSEAAVVVAVQAHDLPADSGQEAASRNPGEQLHSMPQPKAAPTSSPVAATAAHQGSGNTACQLPRIFVSIAAFRDEECQWTLRDLFLKATCPQRIFVGVVWQIDPALDQGFVRMAGGQKTAQYLKQVSCQCRFGCCDCS